MDFDFSKLAQTRFTLPKGCSISSFVIRELNGKDEEIAAKAAKARNNLEAIGEEMARRAIVKVDDMDVQYPYYGMEQWNTKTRSFFMRAFTTVNSPTDEELDDFLASAAEVAG